MNTGKRTPLEVTVSVTLSFDSETGTNTASVVIDGNYGDTGCGFMVLDDPADALILRDALDAFISTNKIRPAEPAEEDAGS